MTRFLTLIIFINTIMITAPTLATTYSFSQEANLIAAQPSIDQLWQKGVFAHFKSGDDLDIHYALFNTHDDAATIVVSPGRSESYLKYKELTYDLINQGYNVAMIDHRGQGLSSRELEDKEKGYVADFQNYVDDFHIFIEQVVKQQLGNQLYLLAHSMGGNIGILYMQQHPKTFVAASLSSPMIAINADPAPAWLAAPLIQSSHFFNTLFTDQSSYFIGHGGFKEKQFTNNDLMHSKVRFDIFQTLYKQTKKIQLGGVTLAWLDAAIASDKAIFANIKQLSTPIMVMQAELDTVVSNEKQDEFCQQLHQHHADSCINGKAVVIKGAKHELLFESDAMRNQSLTTTLDWFNKH